MPYPLPKEYAMSKMSQIDAARQEAGFTVGEVSDWFNRNKSLDREILLMVATDPILLGRAMGNQNIVTPAPKPASEHVALKQSGPRREKTGWNLSMTHSDAKMVMSVFGVSTLIAFVCVIWLAVNL